jgi:hypothetical protein
VYFAAKCNQPACIEVLVRMKADVNIPDKCSCLSQPLHCLCLLLSYSGCEAVAQCFCAGLDCLFWQSLGQMDTWTALLCSRLLVQREL